MLKEEKVIIHVINKPFIKIDELVLLIKKIPLENSNKPIINEFIMSLNGSILFNNDINIEKNRMFENIFTKALTVLFNDEKYMLKKLFSFAFILRSFKYIFLFLIKIPIIILEI